MKQTKLSQLAPNREATNRRILIAARALMIDRGVDGVSMHDVASAASVARATIYLHFAGKQPLLTALLVEDWEGQARMFGRLEPGDPPSLDAITAWLRRTIEGMGRSRASFALHRVALGGDVGVVAMHQAHRRRLAHLLAARLRPASADHEDGFHRVEGSMMIAEIDYVASAAVTEWDERETSAAVDFVADRLVRFAARDRS